MKRFVSIYLPHWPTDCWRRRNSAAQSAQVLFAPGRGGMLISALDRQAAARGLYVGQRLADARALIPGLRSAPADPADEEAALGRLAHWCLRYTPWAATDGLLHGTAGVVLDITGCAHLFGGEAALLADLLGRLTRFGIAARAGAADTPAAAWGWARYGEGGVLAGPAARDKLLALPIEALRLGPELLLALRRLGLRAVGDLESLPRAPLAARFGEEPLSRLDGMFGRCPEPVSPRRPVPAWQERIAFADGIGRREDIDRATRHLLDALCRGLEAAGRGARVLELACYRLDGAVQTLEIGTGKPTHEAAHLMRLFGEKLGALDPGFGIELMILSARATDPLVLHQGDLAARRAEHDLSDVIDRLRTRLGPKRVRRLVPRESHWPERAVVAAPAPQPPGGARFGHACPRPVQLFTPPEPLQAVDGADEGGPPALFRWRRSDYRVVRAEGPERIAPEWWRADAARAARDYFWVQDASGRRFWIYRDRAGDGWYLHGLFA